jgi:hypothetical protein
LQADAVSADRWEETVTDMTRLSMLTSTAAAALGSMASTSTQAAAPPSGKQAPGGYRYKVGTHEVTVLTDGARAFRTL